MAWFWPFQRLSQLCDRLSAYCVRDYPYTYTPYHQLDRLPRRISLLISIFMQRSAQYFSRQLREAIHLFENLGVLINQGRIRVYLDVLDAAERGEMVDRRLLWAAACEVDDIAKICHLEKSQLLLVKDRLRDISGGQAIYTNESGADPGRDLMFELITATKLQQLGAQSRVKYPSDVINQIGQEQLLLECKRPTTFAALGRRLKEGCRQLSEHRRQGHRGFGAIALEVSVLVNPKFGVLVAHNAEAAANAVYGHIQVVLSRANEHIARGARDSRKDAELHMLLLRVKCLTGDGSASPNITEVWQAHPVISIASPEFKVLYKAFSRLSGFVPGVGVVVG